MLREARKMGRLKNRLNGYVKEPPQETIDEAEPIEPIVETVPVYQPPPTRIVKTNLICMKKWKFAILAVLAGFGALSLFVWFMVLFVTIFTI